MRLLAGHNLRARGMILPGHGLTGRTLPAALRSITRLFPGYLDGSRFVCAVPASAHWHSAVGGINGAVFDCAYPTPGTTPDDGPYAPFDCSWSDEE
ncbi:hypothetical protein [Roseinatronobacter sp. NSM]|uniref:hypothetical protein n=1 Tax=Roseinatronobacter sp. NSM TaxID=3457785 RepID=UPI004037383A